MARGFAIDPARKGIIRWGGLSLFAAAVCLVAFVAAVFTLRQTLPVPARELLEAPAVPSALFVVAAVGELLLLPAVFGLHAALEGAGRTRMTVATALWALAVPLFLASRGMLFAAARLGGRYLDGADAAGGAAYVVAAELAIEVQNSLSAMALVLLSLASILIGTVMVQRGAFGGWLGYVAILAGIFSVFTPFVVILGLLPVVIAFIGLVLSAVWQLIAGVELFRLGGAR